MSKRSPRLSDTLPQRLAQCTVNSLWVDERELARIELDLQRDLQFGGCVIVATDRRVLRFEEDDDHEIQVEDLELSEGADSMIPK